MARILEISNLRTYIYQRHSVVHAVDGVSLTVDVGETVGLVGESGCGKSTTGLSILRLLPSGGRILPGSSIKVKGTEVTTLPERELLNLRGGAVGMIFQDPMSSLNPTMTIGKQIAEAVRQHRDVTRRAASARAIEVLGLVGIPQPRERIAYYPHQLSGGLRQRVMIAMALACEPALLIADEPTTALDVTIQDGILTLLDRLKAELGMGLLLITHDLGVIAGRADRTVVMYAGRVVEEGMTTDVFGHMRHPYTKALISSIPGEAAAGRRALFTIPGAPPDLTRPAAGCAFQPRCQFATAACGSQPPLSEDVPGHRYACFHPINSSERDAVETGRAAVIGEAADRRAMPDEAGPLLRVANVVKEYAAGRGMFQRGGGSVKAVSDVSFTVAVGETLGLVGESGCGKTTLAHLLAGLEKPSGGEIFVGGEDVAALSRWQPRQTETQRRARRAVQLMFQDPYSSLDPRMRVGSILREPLAVQRVGRRREQNERIASLLNEVGLRPGSEELYPHEFSGGQRQRIGLARALILDPKLLIADEPVSALDVSIRSQILNLMCTLQDRHRLTYVLISHDLSVIRHMADRIAVMYLGKLVEIGPGPDVYGQPVHHYTAGLIAAAPKVQQRDHSQRQQVAVRGELPSAIDPPSGCRFRTRCAFAEELCAEVEPPLVRFGDGHYAACHFPRRQATRDPVSTPAVLPQTP